MAFSMMMRRRSAFCSIAWQRASAVVTVPVLASAAGRHGFSSNIKLKTDGHPKLVEVPTLPIIGSMISQYSGTPSFLPENHLQTFPVMRRRFGDFYRFGYPGIGNFWHPMVYVLQDPHEYARIMRFEGKYPSGASQYMWPLDRYLNEHGLGRGMNITKQGPEWKRIRSFLQTDLLTPKSADRYLPAIIKAAEHASKGAQENQRDFLPYLNKCSFDLSCAILLGRYPYVADPTTESDPEDVEFCISAVVAVSSIAQLLLDVSARALIQLIGIKNSRYRTFERNITRAYEISDKRMLELLEKRMSGTLTTAEEASYANQAFARQKAESDQEDPIQVSEVLEIVKVLLVGSIDTTATVLAWNILHLALNSKVQQRVREEVLRATTETHGRLTEDVISPAVLPLLFAVIRESHRMAHVIPLTPNRVISEDIKVHGVMIPVGSVLSFDGYSQGMDPDIVDNPDEFRPERFLPDTIASRKGTKSEVLDHPLMSSPFSQGARRCPGSRVARNEIAVLLAQFLLDWKITTDVKDWKDVPVKLATGLSPVLPELNITARSE